MRRRSSRVFIAGLCLVILGLGNWSMGSSKLAQYGGQMAEAREAGGPSVERPFRGTASILEERGEAHDRFASARLKYEYYRVVHRGGLLLLGLGTVFIGGALLRRMLVPS